jgi:hypothetical protein
VNEDGQWIPIKGTLTGGKKIMASRDTTSSTDAQSGSVPFFNIGQERAEAAVALQKELLEAYEQASRAWLARVQSEVALVVRASHEADSHALGPGSPRSLHEMRIAADANDCGARTTRVQGLPTDYAKNHQVVDKWMAIWKHVKAINARPLSFDKYLTSKWERVHETGTR